CRPLQTARIGIMRVDREAGIDLVRQCQRIGIAHRELEKAAVLQHVRAREICARRLIYRVAHDADRSTEQDVRTIEHARAGTKHTLARLVQSIGQADSGSEVLASCIRDLTAWNITAQSIWTETVEDAIVVCRGRRKIIPPQTEVHNKPPRGVPVVLHKQSDVVAVQVVGPYAV